MPSLVGCESEGPSSIDVPRRFDAVTDAYHEASLVDLPAQDVIRDDATFDATSGDARPDVATADAADGGSELQIPQRITAQLVFEAPVAATTPATWNAHLPKLTGDENFFYLNYSYETPDTPPRYSAILQRPRNGNANWTEVARVRYQHQPLGMVMDRARSLHMVFDCLQPMPGVSGECFQGGAGSGALGSRFYHLVFSSRNAMGALRWDTYGNYNEWTMESNGYMGISVAPDDSIQWSLADTMWNRHVQRFRAGMLSPAPVLNEPGRYLLYPITAWRQTGGLMFVGEFDPSGGSNAGYPAASLYALGVDNATRILRVMPDAPVAAGAPGAFPSDLDVGADQTIFALSYVYSAMPAQCTKLFRIEPGGVVNTIPVGCLDGYARLQVVDRNTLVLLSSATRDSMRVGVSTDRGDHWLWHTVMIDGINAADVAIGGWSLIDDRSAPLLYNPERITMVFSGTQMGNTSRRLYFAEFALR